MKKTFQALTVAATVLIALSFQACDKVKDSMFPTFENDDLALEFTIPVTANTGADTIELSSIHFNIDSVVKAATMNVFSITQVKSITVKNVEWTLDNADDQNNFQNLEKASVLFHSSSNYNAVEIASAPSIPYASTDTLTIAGESSANVKNYFSGSDLFLRLAVQVKKPTTKELMSRVKLTISVD